MTEPRPSSEQITEEVTSWPGVTAGPGRRGEFAFKLGAREIGHLHGDHAAHFMFPKELWRELRAQGRIGDHPVFPGNTRGGPRRPQLRGRETRAFPSSLAPPIESGGARSRNEGHCPGTVRSAR